MFDTLFLIDGHAQVYRAFYAVEGLTAPDGSPTGAAYGFTRMLLDLVRRHQPPYLAAVFDSPGPTFRHQVYDQYKATRKPTPPELLAQIPVIHEILAAYRIPVISLPGYEADDLLGALAVQAAAQNCDAVLVTGDKDCAQLLGDRVRILDAKKDEFQTAADYAAKTGLQPTQLPDLFGLVGDTADNIPGVAGIGPKGGQELIAQYGSLENLLEHAAEIKGKRGEKLRECAEAARLSKRLATIDTAAPVTLDLPACAMRAPDSEKLAEIFTRLGFHSLLKELPAAVKPAQKRDYRLVATPEAFTDFLAQLHQQKHFSLDTETTALDPLQADLVGVSLAWEPGTAYYLPFRAPESEPRLGEAELARLAEVLADPAVTKTGQNLKYDVLVLRRQQIEVRGIVFDSLLASNILDGHLTEHGLDALAQRHLGLTKIPTADLIGKGVKQITMAEVPLAQIAEYAGEDAETALRLEAKLGALLDERGERRLLDELELPLAAVLTDMQECGVRVDCEQLRLLSEQAEKVLTALTADIHALAGHEFNIKSPKQLGEVMFSELNLPVVKKTKTGFSTDEDVLLELAAQGHELPTRVLDYRHYDKLKSTYLDALPALVNPFTGRLHTTFSQTATATGRLSSRDPNLQNIPVRTDHGRAIRAAFVPEPGWLMLGADYSQVELRMLAHFCGDEMLKRAFAEGQDIHRVVAAELNHLSPDSVSREQRSAAKAVNFGIIYGQSAHGLAQQTEMNRGEAQVFIDRYFARFPRVREFIDATIETARAAGEVKTILGRRRQLADLNSSNKMKRAAAERMAINTLIQGSAADLIKKAMIAIHRRLPQVAPGARLLLQIHDELLFECPPEAVEALREMVRAEMEHALPEVTTPLTVDIGVGRNWLELK